MNGNYLAFDLGAESGRAMLGTISGDLLLLEELHRFANTPVRLPTGLYWDTLRLFHEIRRGLQVAGRERRLMLDGIGIDTWGVDFGLLGADGALVDNPRHYRDERTRGLLADICGRVSQAEIFGQTGIQFMELNSLYQLYALKQANAPALEVARTLLFMPDLFSFWLTGQARAELTIASTSQFYNPRLGRWAEELLAALDLPTSLLPDLIRPGTPLGPLLPEVAATAGLDHPLVYATAGHDTAAAVAAVPAVGDDWCYISSGTWSLMGVELEEPVINADSLALNYTNEVGAAGRIRLLKNIAGLWPLQECRRAWAAEGRDFSYEELTRLASAAPPFTAVIDPDQFLSPGDMPRQIAQYCQRTGQRVPADPGQFTRTILESLALAYRRVLGSLESLTGKQLRVIHIVGGGSRNQLLNQFVADATGRTVVVGPAEATAAGNVLVQAIGAGQLRDLHEARAMVRRSFPVNVLEPQDTEQWEKHARVVG